jgi:hypothetical protein
MSDKAITEAIALLTDDELIWSSDMNDIRRELANLITVAQSNSMLKPFAVVLAHKLLSWENEPNQRFDDIEIR